MKNKASSSFNTPYWNFPQPAMVLLGDQMSITSHIFVTHNGSNQVELNYDELGRADVHYRYFRASDGSEWNISKYPRRKPLGDIMTRLDILQKDNRYIDVTSFDEKTLTEWRDHARTKKDREVIS